VPARRLRTKVGRCTFEHTTTTAAPNRFSGPESKVFSAWAGVNDEADLPHRQPESVNQFGAIGSSPWNHLNH